GSQWGGFRRHCAGDPRRTRRLGWPARAPGAGRSLDAVAARHGLSRAALAAFRLVFRLGGAAALSPALPAPALSDACLFHPVPARDQGLGRLVQGGLVALQRVCDPRARRWADAHPAIDGQEGGLSAGPAEGGIDPRRYFEAVDR